MERDPQTSGRKQRREQARMQRKNLERAAAESQTRRRRVKLLTITSAFVAAGAVLVWITAAGSAGKIAPESAQARDVRAEVRSLLVGIPQNGDALGRVGAPVTLQYFGDLECPVCRAFTIGALPSIIRNWVRAGSLRIEYHSLETATREPEVFTDQQSAALAAGKQNKMWNFIETFYHEQGEEDSGYVTERFIQGIASQVHGLNLTRWQAERADSGLAAQLEDDARIASVHNLTGTPAFLIGATGGATKQLEPNAVTEAAPFERAIATLAGSAKQS